MSQRQLDSLPPVTVIEKIPVGGDHTVDSREIKSEGIPTPAHLQLHSELGRGGMGRIHPATDRNLLRHVALKRLDAEYSKVPMYRDGFIAEAQMTGQLEHPNIVPVHELNIGKNGVPYFTMKLVQGVGFDRWLQHPDHAPGTTERLREGLEIFLKVCDAVAFAHHRGVIHRDLKPENIMVADFGQVYVMDWGLARLTQSRPASGSRSQMEAPGAVGTPQYMAPEQARGNPRDMTEQSDIFGLGAILYEIVSGKLPYGNLWDAEEILERAREEDIIPITEAVFGVGVSRRICNIIEKSVAPKPQDRYASVVDLGREVREFLSGGLHLPRRVFVPGSIIIKEGDVGQEAYMIISGKCRAYREDNGEQETLGLMQSGDVFGEMALLLDEPRYATVEAVERTSVLVLDKDTMDQGLGFDGWTGALVRALAQRFHNLERQMRASGVKRG